jgi:predicted ATPase/transcriptional regulator with XRE-family HTH domain
MLHMKRSNHPTLAACFHDTINRAGREAISGTKSGTIWGTLGADHTQDVVMAGETTFGYLLKQRRKALDLTREELADRVGCAVETLRKIETNARRPSRQLAELLAQHLALPSEERTAFLKAARAELSPDRLASPIPLHDQAPARHLHNLPAALTSFIGREREVASLTSQLLRPNVRLLTLTGPGGVGKTRLGLQAAAQVRGTFTDGVWFVALAPLQDPDLVVSAIAQLLGVKAVGGAPLIDHLKEVLRDKHMLLVLDNFEHVAAAAPIITELLAAAPDLKVLVTSRAVLHLSGEHEFLVLPLALPDPQHIPAIETLAQSDAVALFITRAQAANQAFELTPANAGTVAAICQCLDGLPFALELAAARVKLFPLQALLARLDNRLAFLTGGARDLATRQQTIRNTIDWSYQLLDSREQRLFARLGIFVGGFTVGVAEAVCNPDGDLSIEIMDGIAALLDQSMLRREAVIDGEPRFLMLEMIREFALEQLRAQGEEPMLRERHYAAYLDFVRAADSSLRTLAAAAWLARLHPEQDNIRAALHWTLDEQRYAETAWLIVAISGFWLVCGQWQETDQWIAQLLPHRMELDSDLRLALMINLYSAARSFESFQLVEHWNAEMLQLLDTSSDMHLHANAWHYIALTYYTTDYPRAAAGWERGIACARAAGAAPEVDTRFCLWADHSYALGGSLWAYGNALVNQGEFIQALPLLLECRNIFQQRGSRYEVSLSLGTLGLLALLRGDLEEAYTQLHEAVTIATDFNDQWMIGFWQPVLGFVTLYTGDVAGARRILSASLRLCTELKVPMFIARIMTFLAETALWEGQIDEAAQWLAQSLTQEAEPGIVIIYEVVRLYMAARVATAQQQYQRAATLFGLAEQANSQIHHAYTGPLRAQADAALATVRAALDPEVFAEAFAAGQQLSLGEAFATILHPTAIAA